MSNIAIIETSDEDYDEYFRIRCSPADIFWNGYTGKPDYNEFRKLFQNRTQMSRFEKPEDRKVFLVQNNDHENIGFTQLIWRDSCIEIGYSIVEKYQRRGYATEALKLTIPIAQKYQKDIIVRIRDDNIASQKVAAKAGFERTDLWVEKDYPFCGTVKLRTYKYGQ